MAAGPCHHLFYNMNHEGVRVSIRGPTAWVCEDVSDMHGFIEQVALWRAVVCTSGVLLLL